MIRLTIQLCLTKWRMMYEFRISSCNKSFVNEKCYMFEYPPDLSALIQTDSHYFVNEDSKNSKYFALLRWLICLHIILLLAAFYVCLAVFLCIHAIF